MKFSLTLTLAVLSLTNANALEGDIPILRELAWKPKHASFEEFVFHSRDEMLKVWKSDGGSEDGLPVVDWEKETVLAVFAGKQSSAGNEVKLECVEAQKNLNLVALWRYKFPIQVSPRGEFFPNHVVVIPAGKYERVRFIGDLSLEGQAALRERERRKACEENLRKIESALKNPPKLNAPEPDDATKDAIKKLYEKKSTEDKKPE